ncbi:MAG: Flagellar protein FlbD [Anaerolineae bacterium]|jgi:flagellar protein FlbD|nr:MAG: Flagellar protein FlbD [Anaerolineae bacterium]
MIQVTRFNGATYFLNAELIQSVEATPDTVITLVNHEKVVVKESVSQILSEFIQYQRLIHNPTLELPYNGEA